MTHEEGASDSLVAIQGRLDRMDTKLDGIHDSLEWQREMLKFHGHHFGSIEALLKVHGLRLDHIDATLAQHGRRFDQIDARFGQIDARFGQIDDRFGQIDEMLGKILARLDAPRP